MDETGWSRTIEIPAIMRALHQSLDESPKILSDPIAPRLIKDENQRSWLSPLLDHPFAPQWRAGFAMRSRYAEDCLEEGMRRGVQQYVILGAGLDTFAYRQNQPSDTLRIYELDHPLTQQCKRDRLAIANIAIPSNLTFVAIDFEKTSIADALARTGFRLDAPSLCSWMGVTQYLTTAAIDATLRFALSLPRASEIVFSFILPQHALSGIEADAVALAAHRSAAVGEPWLSRFQVAELAFKLGAMGFSQINHLTPEEAARRYFAKRRDGLKERQGEQLMRARV